MKQKYFLFILLFLFTKSAFAQYPYMGEIRLFAGSIPPKGWVFCDGQTLLIQKNAPLYNIIGVQFGGDGRTNFSVPNLNGKMVVGTGEGPGLTTRKAGETGGVNTIQLTTNNLPLHSHIANVPISTSEANSDTPGPNKYLAAQNNVYNGSTRPVTGYAPAAPATDVSLTNAGTTNSTGNNVPVSIEQPVLVMRYIIALFGQYPSYQ
jgi:microcystin-dependent protein